MSASPFHVTTGCIFLALTVVGLVLSCLRCRRATRLMDITTGFLAELAAIWAALHGDWLWAGMWQFAALLALLVVRVDSSIQREVRS